VLVVEDHSLPLISLVIALPAGYRHEPPGQEGIATLAASMVLEGIAGGDRIDLLAQYGDLGGTPSANAGASLLTLHCTVQRDQAPLALRLMARTLLESTLDPETFERIRRELRGWFAVNRGEPSVVTGLGLLAGAFDLHPSVAALGHGTPQTLDQLDREAVRTYLQTHLRLDDAVFLLSGDLSESEAGQWVDAASQGWAAHESPTTAPSVHAIADDPPRHRVVLVPWPALPQTFVALGGPRSPFGHPDEPAESMATSLITSVMHHELRSRQRATYGVQTSEWATRRGHFHQTFVAVDPSSADQVVAAMHGQVDLLRQSGRFIDAVISEARLAMRVEAMSSFHGSEQSLSQLIRLTANDFPPSAATERLQWITEVDPQSATNAFRRLYHRDRLCWCIAGPPASIERARNELPLDEAITTSPAALLGLG